MPARTRSAFVDELKDLLRIPSVSTAEEHKDDVRKAAEMVANDLKRIGFEHVEIIPTKGHPLVYADWLHAAGKPIALCYSHYDVQPAEPLDEWKSPPFVDKDAYPLRTRKRELRAETGRSRRSATRTSTPAARWTTKASSGCSSRPSNRCSRAAMASCPSMFACSSKARKKWAARASKSTS